MFASGIQLHSLSIFLIVKTHSFLFRPAFSAAAIPRRAVTTPSAATGSYVVMNRGEVMRGSILLATRWIELVALHLRVATASTPLRLPDAPSLSASPSLFRLYTLP
jgi:hypothetical protein